MCLLRFCCTPDASFVLMSLGAYNGAVKLCTEGAPMALSEKDVRGIAEYAKIALTDDELTEMTAYMNNAVSILEPILQYDLPDVEPTFHPIGSLSNVMGDDELEPARDLPLDVALENAGSARDRYFRVPSILGEGESE